MYFITVLLFGKNLIQAWWEIMWENVKSTEAFLFVEPFVIWANVKANIELRW